MQKTKRPKKGLFILIGILVFFVLGFVALHLSFVLYFDKKIKSDLQKEFFAQTGGTYELQIETLRTDLFVQSVFLSGFRIFPVKGVRPLTSKFFISATKINLEDFNLYSFLTQKDLRFYKLELTNPKVLVFRNNVDAKMEDTSVHVAKFSIYQLIKKHVSALSVSRIKVSNAEIRIYADDKDSLLLLKSKDNQLLISDLRIDAEAERLGRLFLAEKTDLVIHKFSYTTKDSLYTVKVSRLFASYTDSTVFMDSVMLNPNYSKTTFAEHAGQQTDRIKLFAMKIEFNRMDVKQFFEKNWFIAKELKISGFNLEAYRDKNDFRKSHQPLSIQALINHIPVYVKLDSICVIDAHCRYEELAVDGAEPGKIFFHHVDAVMTGLSNRHENMLSQGYLLVNASCKLMNKGQLHVRYRFPYNTDNMVFDCSGQLYGMPFTELNKVLEPIAKVSAVQGEIDSMVFSFHAGEIASDGWMRLIYHDLRVQILKARGGKPIAVEHFLSFLAHSFIIKENNPTRNQPVRMAKIHYVRDTDRFIFNYSLKSLLSGIKSAIGLPERNKKKGT